MKTRAFNFFMRFMALLTALSIAGCASEAVTRAMSGPPQARTDIFPGNYWNYSFGPFQKAENFINVERAQSNESPRNQSKNWADITPSKMAFGNIGNLQNYFMFDVRWKMKDGREFLLENIDTRSISNAYLRNHPIQLPWQRENRLRPGIGDGGAILAFEIKDDAVLLKWVIRINRTPLDQRLTPTGAATKWDFYDEEHVMVSLKGSPTSGINFNIKHEPQK